MNLTYGLKNRRCEMHSNLQHIMMLCRWTGFFPVEGLSDSYPWRIRFNMRSIYSAYYICSILMLAVQIALALYGSCFKSNEMNVKDATNLAFVFIAGIEVILLYRLAKHWPKLIKAAVEIERDLNKMAFFEKSSTKSTIVCYAIIIMGLVEHALCVLCNFKLVNTCLGHNVIDSASFENFFKNHYSCFFDYLPYNIWLGLFVEFIICTHNTFLWNFMDVLGMTFSIYLITYFRELGKAMNSDGTKNWSKLRACYSRVVVLLNLINDQLAAFILLSSFTNLFFICLQLFNSLHFVFNQPFLGHQLCESIPHHVETIMVPKIYLSYYLFSFVFLVTKALMFAYLAASVHTSAYNGLITLYEVPASEYNREVRCFQMQLRYTTVAISGIFFFVQRKMILRAVATIITYELVLLQFSYQVDLVELTHYNYTKVLNVDIY